MTRYSGWKADGSAPLSAMTNTGIACLIGIGTMIALTEADSSGYRSARRSHRMLDLHELAAMAAPQRYSQLKAELADLTHAFPELLNIPAPKKRGRKPKTNGFHTAPVLAGAPVQGIKKKRKMSAAARKRISDAQTARWAKKKAEAAAAAPAKTKVGKKKGGKKKKSGKLDAAA